MRGDGAAAKKKAGLIMKFDKKNRKVQFSFFKVALDVKTEKAQLIKCGPVANPICVWLPLSQITVVDDVERGPDYVLVTLPEWLFAKTQLINFCEPYFVYG